MDNSTYGTSYTEQYLFFFANNLFADTSRTIVSVQSSHPGARDLDLFVRAKDMETAARGGVRLNHKPKVDETLVHLHLLVQQKQCKYLLIILSRPTDQHLRRSLSLAYGIEQKFLLSSGW